jgi:adenylylsulfate kinase
VPGLAHADADAIGDVVPSIAISERAGRAVRGVPTLLRRPHRHRTHALGYGIDLCVGVERGIDALARTGVSKLALVVSDLDPRRILEDQLRQVDGRRGRVDAAFARQALCEQREPARVVKVRVREHDRIQMSGVDGPEVPVAGISGSAALEHAEVNEHSGATRIDEIAAARHLTGGAAQVNAHALKAPRSCGKRNAVACPRHETHMSDEPSVKQPQQHGAHDAPGKNLQWHDGEVARATRDALTGGGCTVWLTGLSGAGKSTIAVALERALVESGRLAYRLDGDNIRLGLNAGLGFDAAGRAEAVRRMGEAALLLADAGVVTIVAMISPYRADRDAVRARHAERGVAFIEAFVDVPLHVAESRDPKGLYAKARGGQIAGFTGISDPYEVPISPEAHLDSAHMSVDQCVAVVRLALGRFGPSSHDESKAHG